MTKYFSKDTPLASLERMMMSVPGFQKRGGGMMVLCRFHYKKEDVDCAYCQSYMRHTCQASVCPYIPERLEAGTVSYQELAEGCLHMAGHQKLWNRLSSLPKGKSLPLVLEPAHRRRLSEWLEAGIATSCPHELAAAYLLSSRAGLWRRVLPHISHGRIDFSSISLRGIDPRDYHCLRKNGSILGETIFDEGAAILYDQDEKRYRLIAVKAGTILVEERLCVDRLLGRLRFTCAHELGHWVLHQKLYSGTGDVAAYEGKTSLDESYGLVEWQADALATALLMPLPQIKRSFYRLRAGRSHEHLVAEMARIFQVSKQAMRIRLETRNLI